MILPRHCRRNSAHGAPNTQLLAYSSDTGGRVGFGQKLCPESRGSHRAERKPRRSAGDVTLSYRYCTQRVAYRKPTQLCRCMHLSLSQLPGLSFTGERVSRSHTQRPRVLSRLTSCSPTCCSLRLVHSSPPPQSLYLSDCSARPLARAVLSARCGPPVLPRSDRSTPCGRGRVPRPRSFVNDMSRHLPKILA